VMFIGRLERRCLQKWTDGKKLAMPRESPCLCMSIVLAHEPPDEYGTQHRHSHFTASQVQARLHTGASGQFWLLVGAESLNEKAWACSWAFEKALMP
jgi:hypothetical protein